MNRLLLAAILSTAMFTTAQAAVAVTWLGHFSITSNSASCVGNYVGQRGLVQFTPELAGTTNGPGTKITFIQDIRAAAFRLNAGLFDTTLKTVDSIYIDRDFGPKDATPVQIRFLQQDPVIIQTNSGFIEIKGDIRNYDGVAGCTIKFSSAVSPKF